MPIKPFLSSSSLHSGSSGVLPKTGDAEPEDPGQTLLRTLEDDLRPLNFGLASARRRAWDWPAWRTLVEAATSSWQAPEKKKKKTRHNVSNALETLFLFCVLHELIHLVSFYPFCVFVCTPCTILYFKWINVVCNLLSRVLCSHAW